VIQKWTPQEDAVLAELIDLALKTNIWEIVKDDGRLVYRGSNGVKKHVASLVCRRLLTQESGASRARETLTHYRSRGSANRRFSRSITAGWRRHESSVDLVVLL
jgi:hypothetical protein